MNILVTGGAGFIGSNFIHFWLKKHPEDRIVNLDLLTYAGDLQNLKEFKDGPDYKFVQGDVCDEKTINELMKGMDLVVHFAAETHVDRSIDSDKEFVRTNVEGTRVLLQAARDNGNVRFHHVSTDEVFGQLGPHDPPFNEKTPYNPRSPYAASKAAADHLVRAYFHTFGLPITISNCSNNYGPRQHWEKMIPLVITHLLQGEKIPLYGDGQNIRDWIHIDDHCRGIELVIKKGKVGETYCLGGSPSPGATATEGGEIDNLSLVKKILALMGKGEEMIEFVPDRPGHDRRYAIDSTKAQTELGWRKEVDFEKGLRETIEWYKNQF